MKVCLFVAATPPFLSTITYSRAAEVWHVQTTEGSSANPLAANDRDFPRPKPVKVHPVDSSGEPIAPAPAIIYSVNENGEAKAIIYVGETYWQKFTQGNVNLIRATTQLDGVKCLITADFALSDPALYAEKFVTIDLNKECLDIFGPMTMNFGALRPDEPHKLKYNNHFVLSPDNRDSTGYARDVERLKDFDSINLNFLTEKHSLIQLRMAKGAVGSAIFSGL